MQYVLYLIRKWLGIDRQTELITRLQRQVFELQDIVAAKFPDCMIAIRRQHAKNIEEAVYLEGIRPLLYSSGIVNFCKNTEDKDEQE